MNRIHRNWFRPVPDWYASWAYRDDARLADDYELPNFRTERTCMVCGEAFYLTSSTQNGRKTCYQHECTLERRRMNRRAARARKAQQA